MGLEVAAKAFVICQPEKVSISSKRDEISRLHHLLSFQDIQIEEKQIKAIYDWPEPQSVHNIQVFLKFVNFSRQFIQKFSRHIALLISMLKTTSEKVRDENLE